MLNALVKLFTGKSIVLYSKHRQTSPLVNSITKSKFIFVDYLLFWKFTYIFGRNSTLRYRMMGMIISLISPKYILDINWITKMHTLFYVWCRKSKSSKFVVVQHGIYAAGIITDLPHRYTKCDIMLCWSEYFKEILSGYNKGKKVNFYVIGNTVYNEYDRNKFQYKETPGHKILIVISPMGGERLKALIEFKDNLEKMGFDVSLKPHPLQEVYESPIEGFKKVGGTLYSILSSDDYDIIMCDTSTSLLDAIFFKKYVMFFSPDNTTIHYTENIYSSHLKNFAKIYKTIGTAQELKDNLSIDSQEGLLNQLVSPGNNYLKMLN